MRLFFNFILVLCCVLSFNYAYAKKYSEEYLIEVGGLNIGNLSWSIFLDKEKYEIKINLQNKGLVSNLYKFKGEYKALGEIKNNILYASSYEQKWKTRKKDSYIKITFKDNKLVKLKLIPEEVEYPRIEYLGIKSSNDPLTSFLKILLGEKKSKTIDGRRVYNMISNSKVEENVKEKIEISIGEYVNIWTDHNRNDLKKIEFTKESGNKSFEMPSVIKIKFKQLVLKLTKI